MDLVPVRIHLRLSNIERAVRTFEGESPIWSFPTYLWTVFFKVDGDTVYVDDHNYKLQGSATIVGTPGDHGDLPGNGDLSNTAIPSQIGEFRTVLTPIPIRSMDDPTTVSGTVSGSVGCAAILMWQRDTPADAVAQGPIHLT